MHIPGSFPDFLSSRAHAPAPACARVCVCVYAYARACMRVHACLSFYSLLFYSRNVAPFWDEAAPFWQRQPPDRNAFRDSILPSDMFIHCLSTRLSTMLSTDEKRKKLRTSCLLLAFPEEESPKGRGREGAYRKPPAPLALPFRCRRKSDVTRRLIFPRRRSLLYSKRAQEREPRKPRRLGSPSGGPPPVTGTSGRAAKPGQVMFHPDHKQKGRSPWQNARMSRQSSPSP